MKKLLLIAACALPLTSCTWVQDQACTGSDALKTSLNDGLAYIPVVGPWSGEITNLFFDLFCAIIGAPESMGRDIDTRLGVQLDPTAPVPDADPGS
jgi:hypothetical protein